jgi:hypothetical protein
METGIKGLEIKEVSKEFLSTLLESAELTGTGRYTPVGLFILEEEGSFVAVDNATSDAWTECFTDKDLAFKWLRGDIEIDDLNYTENGYCN